MTRSQPWRVSLHGGHCAPWCDHAHGTLIERLETACDRGFSVYGCSEHMPRLDERFLYRNEREMGWTVATLVDGFERYMCAAREQQTRLDGRITFLVGMETDNVPEDRWVEIALAYRQQHQIDYIVGSAHYVAECGIDGDAEEFENAMARCGGLTPLAVRYYRTLAEVVDSVRPDVVGHLDLIRKIGRLHGDVDTGPILQAAEDALQAVKRSGAILDINLAGYRLGFGHPYPAPHLLARAIELGIPLCFGDDSHHPNHVGMHYEQARQYLLDHGATHITSVDRNGCRQTHAL